MTIENKKYVLIPEEEYLELQRNAALKRKPEKTFSVEEARAYSKKLILQKASAPLTISAEAHTSANLLTT